MAGTLESPLLPPQALQEETGRILELQAQVAALSAQQPQQPAQQQPPQRRQQDPADAAASPAAAAGAFAEAAAPGWSAESNLAAGASLQPGESQPGDSDGRGKLEVELQAARAELQATKTRLEEEAAQNRAKQKLLAKEVCGQPGCRIP